MSNSPPAGSFGLASGSRPAGGDTRDARGKLLLGGVPVEELVREADAGTPAYIYDLDAIESEARALIAAFEGAPHLVAYAVKANSAAGIIRALASCGVGADVVSGAELALALACGISADAIVYSGVAKTDDEIDRAITAESRGILAIQAESVEEIHRIAARAQSLGREARVSLRVNPGVDLETMDTHAHIATGHDEAKFGIPLDQISAARAAITRASSVSLVGLTAHVGSQFTSTDAYVTSARALFSLAREVRKDTQLAYLDTGGGFGIDYGQGCPASPADFVRDARAEQKKAGLEDLRLVVEPGRSLVGAHGILIARVIQRKDTGARRWLMIDAGMNDLMRPALYQAWHRVVPIDRAVPSDARVWRVVGPVCESSDDFGAHPLPDDTGDFVALLDAGAYGYSMASRYNGRALPAEVFVRASRVVFVNPRKGVNAWVSDRLASGP